MWRNFLTAPPMIPLITVLFLLVNGLLFLKLGVSVDDDSYRYLGYAEEIRERGLFFKSHEFWYIGYVIFIIAVTAVYPSLGAIIVAQVLISYLAVISLYASARHLFGCPWAGLRTVCFFLGFFMISFWNFWIFAESLFISLNCLSLYFLVRWVKKELTWPGLMAGAAICFWTMFTKPTGVALLAALCALGVYFALNMATTKVKKIAVYFFIIIGFIVLLNAMLGTFGFVNDYKRGEIVYNIHKLSHMDYAKWLILAPPDNLYIPDEGYPPLFQLFALMAGNPFYAIKLFSLKFFFFITDTRPYYSAWHNVYNVGILLPAYFLFGYNIFKKLIPQKLVWFSLTFITVTLLSSTLMTIDWNGRFLLPMLPICFLLASGVFLRAIRTAPCFSNLKRQLPIY
jgi:hypothetical protein